MPENDQTIMNIAHNILRSLLCFAGIFYFIKPEKNSDNAGNLRFLYHF